MDSGRDREANKRQAEELLAEAAKKGASLVLLPETWEYIGPEMAANGCPCPGEISDFLKSQAREKGLYLLGGSFGERSSGEKEGSGGADFCKKVYNTALFYSPAGELLGKYRKAHLFDVDISGGPAAGELKADGVGYRESAEVLPGQELATVGTELGKIGMSICYDLRFPELYRLQALGGAEVLAVAANFTHATGAAHWELLLRARAVENSCYVLACNQCGQKAAFKSYGNSMVISPWGEVLARAGEEPCCLMAELDLGEVRRVRRELPSLKNRREDLYLLEERRRGGKGA